MAPFQDRHSEHIVAPLLKRNIAYTHCAEMRGFALPELYFLALAYQLPNEVNGWLVSAENK